MTKLIRIKPLSELTGLDVRSIRTLQAQRKIPFCKVSHKIVLFDAAKVIAALEKFEVRAVS